MRTTFDQSTHISITEDKTSKVTIAEVIGYAGSFMAMGAVSLFLYENWGDITQAQRTATFSLLAIFLFVAGLIASNGAEIRRRVSSYLYSLAAISSGVAVYVTFPDTPVPLQSFALATVVALLGYTISATLLGHLALFIASAGTLIGLGYETVDSENLRLYTQVSLIIAFALTWLVLGSIRMVHQDLGLLLGSLSIMASSQYSFFLGYENLSYLISIGFLVVATWLYTKIPSWVLAATALIALGTSATEFVIATMENSLAAVIGMLIVGGIVTTIGIRSSSSKEV